MSFWMKTRFEAPIGYLLQGNTNLKDWVELSFNPVAIHDQS